MHRKLAACLMAVNLAAAPVLAQTQSGDLEALQRRIADLEAKNREIVAALAELSGQVTAAQAKAPEQVTSKTSTDSPAPVAVVTEGNRSRLSFYGFARVDAILDDSRPNAAQTPTFIPSENATARNNDDFTLHPRLTRLGMNYAGPTIESIGGARLGGKVELDFQNGGSESRAIPRARQLYARLDWQHGSLLLGQTSDIIAPLFPSVNADTLMWNAGNLGDRRTQIRYGQTSGPLSFTAGLALTGAVDQQDLDGNGIRDGEDSGIPHVQARAGYKADGVELGIWGHYANAETTLPVNGRRSFDSHSIGIDFLLQPHALVSIKGELWTGVGLSDVRGGIGQSVNLTTGRAIDSSGGWFELGVKASSIHSVALGWTYDDPANKDLSAGARKLNRAWYLVNQLRLGPALLLGLDYLRWRTGYLGLPQGTDHRFNLYGVYTF